jgi:threonine/homoserine/homoserine lactone efflux protein
MHLDAFFAVSAVVIVIPGPDTALTIRNSLAGGRRAGLATGAGVSVGQIAWAGAAATGMTAVLAASGTAFDAIRIAGAGYLIFLGLRSILAAVTGSIGVNDAGGQPHRIRWQSAFGQGTLSNLANPKMAVFFASLLPQFTGPGVAPAMVTFRLGLTFSGMTFAWLAGYATVVRAGPFLLEPRIQRVLAGACGTALIGLGLWLAAEAT